MKFVRDIPNGRSSRRSQIDITSPISTAPGSAETSRPPTRFWRTCATPTTTRRTTMAKHARKKQTQIRAYLERDEFELIDAIRGYREGTKGRGHAILRATHMVPEYAHSRRHRAPGKHARRWDQ